MGANSRLQYQNQFIATDADQITTQTANTDEVLLAETTWDEVINGIDSEGNVDRTNFSPRVYRNTVTDTAKGDIVVYDGTNYLHLGSLSQFDGITSASLTNTIAAATATAAFSASTTVGNILIVTQDISGVPAAQLAEHTSNQDVEKGDIFQAVTTSTWIKRGDLEDLPEVDDLTSDINVAGALSGTPTDGEIDVFNAVATGLSPIKAASEYKFHPVQPLIIESSLRGGGENIPLPYKTGNSAMTKDAPGPISVEEGMVFAGTGDGMEMFYRMMTQTRMPEATRLNSNTGKQTLIAAGDLSAETELEAGDPVTNPSLVDLSTLNDDVTSGKIPVKLDVTPNAAPGSTGLVKIEGEDKDGLPIQEFLAWGATETGSKKTKNYYASGIKYSSSGWTSTPTLEIACTDTSYKVVYEPQDEELVAFWFVRLVTGITPRLFSGVIGNSFEVALSRDTALEWTVSCLGKRSWPNRNIRGEEWNAGSGNINNQNRRGRKVLLENDSGIGFADPSIFTGWQCELDIGGTRMALIDSTLSINQNLENSGVITGDRYEEAQPFRGTDREVMVDGTVVYSPENNLSQVYLDNATLEDVHLNLRNRPRGGFYWLTRFVFPTTQINTNPDPASPRDGRISQTFNLKCFHEGVGGNPRDYYIETIVPDYEPVREFSV